MSALEGAYREAARILKRTPAVALTGAGVSVASGIPDFRSPGGLWSRHDPAEVASLQALRTNPAAVWRFMAEAYDMFAAALPNPAHLALAAMEREGLVSAVVTQNIDSLHQRAGSREVVEFHGNGARCRCMRCAREGDASAAYGAAREGRVPLCGECGGTLRPDVVFFGEGIPPQALRRTEELVRFAECILVVGTSGEVMPANTLPYRIKNSGGFVIEINLGPTGYAGLPDIRFDAPAEVVLPHLYECSVS
ncbi:NAD-dependent deacetylase [Desulfobaculum xiamenense]|uniref:protein acetyllysine N-acetyltransferase n=1 Tax=Desulfobaculum xiamenense TaxID=995050 RepID=A0A846QRS7_9BACT|nr:Sir2 family NAD-dependent protein deacetylase [Desulfobaculum xiamenense]NJB67369.1 NAD-dependent deacetylase [Desulfobaculum xiamenense]